MTGLIILFLRWYTSRRHVTASWSYKVGGNRWSHYFSHFLGNNVALRKQLFLLMPFAAGIKGGSVVRCPNINNIVMLAKLTLVGEKH